MRFHDPRACTQIGRVGLLAVLACGCRANPPQAMFALIGGAVESEELKKREPELLGKGPEAADAMFGWRFDTLTEKDGHAQWLVYLKPDSSSGSSRYVVQVVDGKIATLYSTEQNPSGATDAIRSDVLRSKWVGKPVTEAEAGLELGPPQITATSRRTDRTYYVFDALKKPMPERVRYCILESDRRGTCVDVRLVGITASTKPGAGQE